MRNRYTQRPDNWDYTGNQIARLNFEGFCTFCPAHSNENSSGSHSKWGKKVAAKTFYATGKGRKTQKNFYRRGKYIWLYDKHFDEKIEKPKRRKRKLELDYKGARYILDEYIKFLKNNRNVIADRAARNLNRYSWSEAQTSLAEQGFGYKPDSTDFSIYVTFTRKKPYYRYLPPES